MRSTRLWFVSALLLCISIAVDGEFKTRERGGYDVIARTATWANSRVVTAANKKIVGGSHLNINKGDRKIQAQQRRTRQRRHGMEPPNGSANFMSSIVFHAIDEVPQESVAADDVDAGKKVKAMARIGSFTEVENSDKDGRSKGVNSEDTDSLNQDDVEGTTNEGTVGTFDDPLADDQGEGSDGKLGAEPAADFDGDDDSKGKTEKDQLEGHPEHGDDDDDPDFVTGGTSETSNILHSQSGGDDDDDADAGNTTDTVGKGDKGGVKSKSNVLNARGESREQDQAAGNGSVGARSKVKGSKKLKKEKNKKIDNKSKQYRPTTIPRYDPSLSDNPSTIMPDEPSTAPVVLTVIQGRPSANPTVSAPYIRPPTENESSARPSSTTTDHQAMSDVPRASPSSEPTDLAPVIGSITSVPIADASLSPGPSSFVTSQEVDSPTLTQSPNPTIDSPSSMPSCLQQHDCTRSQRPV